MQGSACAAAGLGLGEFHCQRQTYIAEANNSNSAGIEWWKSCGHKQVCGGESVCTGEQRLMAVD